MQALSPMHRIVMRELALGFQLREICEVRRLDYEQWDRITSSKLFQAELEKVSQEIDQQLIAEASDDPALALLKSARLKAAQRVVTEIDNEDKETGGTATTRLAASKEVLGIAGITTKQDQKAPTVVINISQGKAMSLKTVPGETIEIPENVIGVPS